MLKLKDIITLSREFYDKVKPFDSYYDYEEHVVTVGACASIISAACGLDVMKAGIMGYAHDIGKLISCEKKDKTFHGLTGYEYLKSIGENELAQVCLTHSFPNINFEIEEYISYGKENIEKSKSILQTINITDYDRVIQLSDLLVNFDGRNVLYDNIKGRMTYIENAYNVNHKNIRIKYKNAIRLKLYLERKYNINIYELLGVK